MGNAIVTRRRGRSLATLQSQLDTQREKEVAGFQARVDEEAKRRERIREEVLRWANPILGAIEGLESRLKNILSDKLYLALRKSDDERPVKADWAISYEYALPSTLFLFAEYFAWIRLLQERLGFELFESEETKGRFFAALWRVSNALSDWPRREVRGEGRDAQVFALQQRAIGELMVDRESDDPRPMSYFDFLEAYRKERGTFRVVIQPLRELVEDVEPGTRRWARLSLTLEELGKFENECRELLRLRVSG